MPALDRGASDPAAVRLVAQILDSSVRYVADDQRAAFDRWVIAKFGAQARALEIWNDDPEEPLDPDWQSNRAVFDLVASTHDPVPAAHMIEAMAHEPSIDPGRYHGVIELATHADPSLATKLIQTLRATTGGRDRQKLLYGLGTAPGILELLVRDPDSLTSSDDYGLALVLANVCDAKERAAAVTLATRLFGSGATTSALLAPIDHCIALRGKLAPVLRAMLPR